MTSRRIDVAPLDVNAIGSALKQAWPGACRVEAVDVTQSTNDDLALRARARQADECVLRAADFQTGGRGRHSRAWRAAPGHALLFSIAVPIAAPGALPAVTLACGVALADVLADHDVAVHLKWPNDVRTNGGKLAGILSELIVDHAARHTLIVGVGVNWHLDDEARRAIGQPAVALRDVLPFVNDDRRERWIGRFGGAVLQAIQQFVSQGFEPFRERFNQLLEARGQMVDVIVAAQAQPISGRVLEVDSSGCLIIDVNGERHAVTSGDVLMRARP